MALSDVEKAIEAKANDQLNTPEPNPHTTDPQSFSPSHLPEIKDESQVELSHRWLALSCFVSHTSTIDPGPPPDSGLKAWTQVFAGHLVVFNTWGYVNSFGVFQTYYVGTLGHPPSDISWVGSVQIFLLFFVGTFSGRASSIFQLLGVFTTSFCTKYWQIFLAQGLCTGIGNGLVFCPTISLVATYFSKNRAIALAITASGTATGGMVFPGIVEATLDKIGFAWTVRLIGFVMLVLQAVALALAKTRLPPRTTGPLVEWAAFKELPYSLFAIGSFLNFWASYFAYFYLGSFGRDIIHVSSSDSFNFLIITNGMGTIFRWIPGILSDRYFGPLNTIVPVNIACGIVLYCWIAIDSRGGLIAFSVLYGSFVAALQALFPAALTSLTTDLKKVGTRTGMVFSIVAFAVLTGPPLAGALISRENGSYTYAQVFAGTAMTAGSCLLAATRFAKTGPVLRYRC
ncbi:hypothetical protein MMC25_001383 [Agyrium rufum]|nr:hypothetical protein [Agyrium rufum]